MDDRDWLAQRFEEERPHLVAVADRMLGSLAEAEDVVQETWVRFNRANASAVENVQPVSRPAGEVAMTTHWGEYSEMHGAYAALERWCVENDRPPAGIKWEVYGDWHADPPGSEPT